jgi:hypothetical protein
MLLLLSVLAFSEGGYEEVPLTNDIVESILPYAIASERKLFPDAPQTGEHPAVLGAALQIVAGADVRFLIQLSRGVEFNLTVYRNVKGELQITNIQVVESGQISIGGYRWEAVTALTERTKTEIKTGLAADPYAFAGEITTVLAYRTEAGTTPQSHHVIFQDENRLVHSVVFHSRGNQVTIASFATVEQA